MIFFKNSTIDTNIIIYTYLSLTSSGFALLPVGLDYCACSVLSAVNFPTFSAGKVICTEWDQHIIG